MNKELKELTPIVYPSNGEDVEVLLDDESVWATAKSISDLFNIEKFKVESLIVEIFENGELEREDNFREKIVSGASRPTVYYSLDVVISAGYRINSKLATQFRLWATSVLKQYLKDGFVINEEILRSDPKKLNELAAKLRELRANEKNVYASVRECFKLAASDYEPTSDEVRKFYILLQDKFHHAITKMTSSKLILDRANHSEKNMGLQIIKGFIPTKSEVNTGKNYLSEIEIYRMHLLSEQFLLYAESTSLAGKTMTMKSLHEQLDNLLRLNGYSVFDGYIDYLKDRAIVHAKREYDTFLEIKKLEHLGVDVDLNSFYLGDYEDYKEQTSQITMRQLNKSLVLKDD